MASSGSRRRWWRRQRPPMRKTTIMGDVGVLEIDITRREASFFSTEDSLSERICSQLMMRRQILFRHLSSLSLTFPNNLRK